MLVDLVQALNEMYAGGTRTPLEPDSQPSAAQWLALGHLRRSVDLMKTCPPDLTTSVAPKELQVTGPYDGEIASTRVPLEVDRISLPSAGSAPVPVAQLLGSEGQI